MIVGYCYLDQYGGKMWLNGAVAQTVANHLKLQKWLKLLNYEGVGTKLRSKGRI